MGPSVPLTRYATLEGFKSAFDPLKDLTLHLEFLRAKDYALELLVDKHGLPRDKAEVRAIGIGPHATLAIRYIEQAAAGPADVSFVSCYYAILNLIKIRLLFSPLAGELPENRLHGAAYDPTGPVSQPLFDERIALYDHGAIPLFFRSLTGIPLPTKTIIRMADVYPYIQDISHEWSLARRGDSRLVALRPDPIQVENGWTVRWFVEGAAAQPDTDLKYLPALGACELDRDHPGLVVRSPLQPLPHALDPSYVVAGAIDRRFLFFPNGALTITAIMSGPIAYTEEMPIVLAFYHLSSVARYNPELLEHLRNSRFWPAIASLREHGFLKFLLLFWSDIRQAHVEVSR